MLKEPSDPAKWLTAAPCSYNSNNINDMRKVTAPQPLQHTLSTPNEASASITVMNFFSNPSSTGNARTTVVGHTSKLCRHTLKQGWPKRDKQRGAGRFKAIVWTLILATFVYVCVKVVPELVNEYQFQDGIQTIARFASVNHQPVEQIRAAVLKEAQKDGVPVAAEDLKIESVGGNIRIKADYSITIDLMVYQWTLNFHPAASNDSLT
jgi:hypothetical protein